LHQQEPLLRVRLFSELRAASALTWVPALF
jgi:hypothetical protein